MAVEDTPLQAESLELSAAQVPGSNRAHWAMNVLGIILLGAICSYGELVLVVILISVLLAFVLAPAVDLLQRLRLRRSVATLIAVLLLAAGMGEIFYYSYNQAVDFGDQFPYYAGKVRSEILQFRKKAESLNVLPTEHEKGVVNVRTTPDWTDILTRGFGSLGTLIAAGSFVPFLAYFMLTCQEHVRSATVMLFPLKDRHTAYVTLGLISAMVRSFIVGNLVIGIILGVVSTTVFGVLHLPFFYFAGFLSGFLSLIPYLGILLALVPPVFVGLGHLQFQGILIIFLTVMGAHLIGLNVLYPKILGSRLQLNPLALTIALLFWGVLWGGAGLLLAVPITGAMKIVFDHVESLKPYGAWLGE